MRQISNDILRRISILVITSVVVVSVWYFAVLPELEKIPNNFHLYMEQEGQDQIASSVNGDLSEPFKLRESLIQKTISDDGRFITISSVISGKNEFTGEEIFHSDETYTINVYDFKYKDEPQKQFWFGPGVKQQDYQFYHPLVFANTPLVYQRVEQVEGLNTYVFRATTSQNNISDNFPQFQGVTILSDTTSDFWIEPTTGNLVKFEKNWEDYTTNGDQRIILQKGGKHTTDYSIFILSEAAKTKIENINLYTKIIPSLLVSLVIGINIILALKSRIGQINDRLKKSEKLVIIGTFAARLAHDLRNPLTVMKSQLGLMTDGELENKEVEHRVMRLTSAVDRMNRQIDDIVDFVKDRPPRIAKISSEKLIESSLQNTMIPSQIKVSAPSSDRTIYGDFTQLETVLSNMITNAIQAIEGPGTITISITEEQNDILLSIANSGPGIPKKDMEKIFEPLYTTKKNGTGLGLSSCQTILKNHGGRITVENNPTTFTLHMPKTHPNITIENN